MGADVGRGVGLPGVNVGVRVVGLALLGTGVGDAVIGRTPSPLNWNLPPHVRVSSQPCRRVYVWQGEKVGAWKVSDEQKLMEFVAPVTPVQPSSSSATIIPVLSLSLM